MSQQSTDYNNINNKHRKIGRNIITYLSLDLKQMEEYWDFWISGFTGRRERVLFLV